jgi:precorrin-2 dehydrogenase/sirohydrochlorin ferrochelatase
MSTYYPIFLNIQGRKCVVVGGGEVAERKARALAEQGASVTVISARVCNGLAQLAEQGTIQISRRDFQSGDLEDALIAIAATDDPMVNMEVAREGRVRGVLTNVVDAPEHSDFIVPSLLRRGDISIAVSTGGKSPALARRIRTELEQSFASEYASLALLISEVRQELKRDEIHVDGNAWQRSLDLEPLLDMLKKGEFEQAKQKLLSNLLRK